MGSPFRMREKQKGGIAAVTLLSGVLFNVIDQPHEAGVSL